MKLKKYSKLIFVSFLLIISILFSSSCSFFGWGTVMPSINVTNEFENEKWLLIDNLLINKELLRHDKYTVQNTIKIFGNKKRTENCA